MRIDVVTIFPKMFDAVIGESIIKRAQKKDIVTINIIDLRMFSKDKHRKVDDRPFGGGPGMVMRPEPFFEAFDYIKRKIRNKRLKTRVILMSPKGITFKHDLALRLSKYDHMILLCGHYEGIDERVREYLAEEDISIGDFILTGGELAAMVVIDAVVRLMPGSLGNERSSMHESFSKGILECPQYTRPADYRGMEVPEVLLSGDHKKIEKWRGLQSLNTTKTKRPDLMNRKKEEG